MLTYCLYMKKIYSKRFVVLVAVLGLLVGGLPFAYAAPAAVTNFSGNPSTTSVSLTWDTPSDNTLSEFELRFSDSVLNDANFNVAPQASGLPQPVPGTSQGVTVFGLAESTTYYFGIRAYNIMGEASPITFLILTTTASSGGGGPQCTPPQSVSGVVSTPSINSVDLNWNTPSQFELSQFEVRMSESTLTDANFNLAAEVSGAPQPVPGGAQSVTIGGLNSETAYYFGIRVYNICGAASPIVFVSATTQDSGGGGGSGGGGTGGGGGGYIGPSGPTNPSILINNDDATVATTSVTLSLGAVNAIRMAISNDPGFSGTLWEGFQATKAWELTPGEGTKVVYAKFQDIGGFESGSVSDDILFEIPVPPAPTPPPTPTPTPPSTPTPTPTPVVSTPVDFNALMVSWGSTFPGGRGDLNFDGVVDNEDVSLLAQNWRDVAVNGSVNGTEVFPSLVSLSPNTVTVAEGERMSYVVTVFPRGDKEYTAQVVLKYPAEFLSLERVEYGSGWVPVVRPEYDAHDTEKGIVVKTAGYPNGFSEKKVFAVLTFRALTSGTGDLSFETNSFTLNSENTNTLGGVSVPDRALAQSLSTTAEGTEALANILTFGEGGNIFAVLILFIFFGFLYVSYRMLPKRKERTA